MEINGRIIRQMILFTLVVLIIPMILFPERLGSDLLRAPFHYALFEFVFYGFVLFLFNRKASLLNLLRAAGLCLVYRLTVGAVFGVLIVAMYPMNFSVALTLGISSYLPGIILHIASTPFILKPVFGQQTQQNSTPKAASPQPAAEKVSVQSGTTSFVATKENKHMEQPPVATDYSDFLAHKSEPAAKTQNENGFQNAVHYICEAGSVLMAAVIDHEGLLLAGFKRGEYEPEDVAPYALPISVRNLDFYKKMNLVIPEKTDLMFENKRMIIATEKSYSLVVLSERTVDDVLSIRINQALEMIRTYTAERYSEKLIGNAERIYV